MSSVVTASFVALPGRVARAVFAGLAALLALSLLAANLVAPAATARQAAPAVVVLVPGVSTTARRPDLPVLHADGVVLDLDDLNGEAQPLSDPGAPERRPAASGPGAGEDRRVEDVGVVPIERPPRA